jgi:hypothetical protein
MTSGPALPVMDQVLNRVIDIEGVVAASLIEATSGLVLASAQIGDVVDPALVAAGAADLVFLLADLTARTGLEDELEDVMITLSGRYHIVRIMPGQLSEPLAMVATFDRRQTNLAMARRELREVGERFGA